ncbi:MAG: hypothetical protein H7A45_03360 [Verrucomicrobiales bacterium]|nr:hypothetical protein [Verrucomicrobiales bacterium]MCP5527768.1 hypothetical protein [Verrucomicrobiales bacterium]
MRLSIAAGTLTILLCLNVSGQTDSADLLSDPLQNLGISERREVPLPLPPDSALEFFEALQSLAQTPDLIRLRSLYCSEGDEDLIVASMTNLGRVLKEGNDQRLGFWLKEIDKLPERSRELWGGMVNKLTSREASGVCMITVPGEAKVMIVVRRTDEGLKIVVEDRVLSKR